MSDADATAKPQRRIVTRPARFEELGIIHALVVDAISTSPFYSDAFKAFEIARHDRAQIERLHNADPSYTMAHEVDGEIAGCMLSSPELGTLWLHWSYLKPEYRRGGIALSAMRYFVEYFDNDRFHKIATYTKPGNDIAEAIMKRYGYRHIATLEKHIFGEDYLLYERPLTKTVPGYDTGIAVEGRLGRLTRRIKRMVSGLKRPENTEVPAKAGTGAPVTG